jgi:hypothetical protein
MKLIDGSVPNDPTVYYPLPKLAVDMDAAFLYSNDLDEVETGARALGKTADILGLVLGIAIIRIERDGLWNQAGFSNLRAYRIEQSARLGLPAATISRRRRVAEAWLSFKKQLSRVQLEGNISKLEYFQAAMDRHQDTRLVVEHFRKDTYDEFVAFARPDLVKPELPAVGIDWTDDGLVVSGRAAFTWAADLPAEDREWLQGIATAAFQARAGGNLAHVVSVYDKGEARAVDNFLKKLRAEK